MKVSEEILNSVKVATASCARVSYSTIGSKSNIRLSSEDITLHDVLLKSGHMSPFEHCARVMSDEEYYSGIKTSNYPIIIPSNNEEREINGGIVNMELYPEHKEYGSGIDRSMYGWCRNYRGFKQYRDILETKN